MPIFGMFFGGKWVLVLFNLSIFLSLWLHKFFFSNTVNFDMQSKIWGPAREGPFERRTADFLWMMLFGAFSLLVSASCLLRELYLCIWFLLSLTRYALLHWILICASVEFPGCSPVGSTIWISWLKSRGVDHICIETMTVTGKRWGWACLWSTWWMDQFD